MQTGGTRFFWSLRHTGPAETRQLLQVSAQIIVIGGFIQVLNVVTSHAQNKG